MEKYYLGLDQGTTGTTALIFDSQWNQIARGYKEHTGRDPGTERRSKRRRGICGHRERERGQKLCRDIYL